MQRIYAERMIKSVYKQDEREEIIGGERLRVRWKDWVIYVGERDVTMDCLEMYTFKDSWRGLESSPCWILKDDRRDIDGKVFVFCTILVLV